MQYLLLGSAIVLEIIATTFLKASDGFSKLIPSVCCACFYALCFYLFSKSLLKIDLGVAYATWCAGGISAIVFGQKLSTLGMIGIALIVAGCVIVNLYGSAN